MPRFFDLKLWLLCLAWVACVKDRERLVSSVPAQSQVGPKQILFGDLHVHSTYSVDAFVMNLPLMSGEGARPLSEACDFARYCSGLDFWATTEHAESMTPRIWSQVKEQMRACDAALGADNRPETIVFTGFEWTQLATDPRNQYGHKNVIFKYLEDDRLPKRPIAMGAFPVQSGPGKIDPAALAYLGALLDLTRALPYAELSSTLQDLQRMKICPAGVDTRKLPVDCQEVAPDAATLFEKLAQWGYEVLVIPHGTAWGLHVPIFSDWATQLDARAHRPEYQRLFEVYSGHGASEQWKPFVEHRVVEGKNVCPEPSPGYEPCCWRAGEIVRNRCSDPGSAACEEKVQMAREKFMAAGLQGFRTVPDTSAEDWLACGQCQDCFLPAFNYRTKGTAQRALAVSRKGPDGKPMRFKFGFVASSDTHRAAPGAGITEHRSLADGAYPRNAIVRGVMGGGFAPALDWEFERQASFWYTGGLAAVHAVGKTREAIWDALQRREVYGTSGPRILLWFDLIGDAGQRSPMGSDVAVSGTPRFEVRAVGAFKQKPGCLPDAAGRDGSSRERICRGNCYNPTDERIPITRIEVVRIRPQMDLSEPMEQLLADPWKILQCEDTGQGCRVSFDDPEFMASGRPAVYYVRAIQAPTPAVNGAMLRCEYDAHGRCVRVHPCYGDYRTPKDDQCFAAVEERAWSSPIFVVAAE